MENFSQSKSSEFWGGKKGKLFIISSPWKEVRRDSLKEKKKEGKKGKKHRNQLKKEGGRK